MSATISIDITEVYALSALRSYLLSLMPAGTEIVKGNINCVPSPVSQTYIVMQPLFRTALDLTVDSYQDNVTTGFAYSQRSTQLTVQCDFHGATAGDLAQIFTTLFRDQSACAFFSSVLINGVNMICQPLYTSEPRMIPFINDQNQWEYRYSVDAELQINPTVTQTQQFAASLNITVIEVDATYKP